MKSKVSSYHKGYFIVEGWYCGYCDIYLGYNIPDICGDCGNKVILPYCGKCGSVIKSKYCTRCGKKYE